MVPTTKKNTVALGDNEHKGKDVSPRSPIGLATTQLLRRPPGSLPQGLGLGSDRGVRRGWFVHSSFLCTGSGSTALDVPLVREQNCATGFSWSLTQPEVSWCRCGALSPSCAAHVLSSSGEGSSIILPDLVLGWGQGRSESDQQVMFPGTSLAPHCFITPMYWMNR